MSSEEKPALTNAEEIWNEIKDVQLNMFSLPDQTVEKYCTVIPVEPSKLYLTIKVSSVFAIMEDVLGKKFEFIPAGKFILVSRK